MANTDKKKQQMEYIIVAVLSVIVLFIAVNKFAEKGGNKEDFAGKSFNEKLRPSEKPKMAEPHKEEGIKYTAIDGRIPFKSPLEWRKKEVVEEEIILPVMIVEGMIWNSPRPQAVIDKKIYDVDDIINGAKIKDVSRDGVYLSYKGKEFVIRPKALID